MCCAESPATPQKPWNQGPAPSTLGWQRVPSAPPKERPLRADGGSRQQGPRCSAMIHAWGSPTPHTGSEIPFQPGRASGELTTWTQ